MKLPYLSILAIAASGAITMVPAVLAQADLPPGAMRITPDELRFGPGRVPGHVIAPLIGVSNKPGVVGVYVERMRFPVNTISQAHSHPEDRTYTVISGTRYVGYGDTIRRCQSGAMSTLTG